MEKIYQQDIARNIDALFARIAPRVGVADSARIREAYHFAAEAHSAQRRKSGEPYIVHPIAVARIIAEELELSPNPIIAAFLHDVVEDTPHTLEEIRARFGDDVAFLVKVVTKEKKEHYEMSKQVDNYRQILGSVRYDVRALLIKLADRLHNMRTLSSMRPDKQMKIAGETDYFYAPLANRLGLYHIKTELENLSFRYRCPRDYADLEEQLNNEIATNAPYTGIFMETIDRLLREKGIEVRTEIRYRRPYSIWRKMHARNCDFNHVDGKHYIRIIYPNPTDCSEKDMSLKIYSVLTDHFKERPGSVSNYIDNPKENGYQSFHVKLLSGQGVWEEIHIASERMVRHSRLGCAAEQTEENVSNWLTKFRAILMDVAYQGNDHELEFMEGVTSTFYYDDIMVFTPKGHGIILPKGASALDFAFEIHSEVGLHAHYARINGKLASMKTPLKRGDCVEIFTSPEILPQEDWLESVQTFKAKSALVRELKKQATLEYDRCPICHPLPGDEVIGFNTDSEHILLHKRNCARAIRHASQHGDSLVNVSFEEDSRFLYPVRIKIHGVDRYHLLSDLIECITERLKLSMLKLETHTVDHIATCTIDFSVHSIGELQTAIRHILAIDSVDEVQRVDIE